jgi:CRP/FNR family transcriptional regulator/CRP/FNR family cyclic AMP-dependent transcriptional regulator
MTRTRSAAREFLAKISLFSELDDELLDLLAGVARWRKFARYATVVRQGDTDGDLYVVASGLLRISVRTSEGKEFALGLLGSPEVFGEIALVDGAARSATVSAQKPSELLVLPRSEAMECIQRVPQLAFKLLVAMATHVRRLTRRVEELGALPVSARTARRLVEIAELYGTRLGPNRVALPLDLSQQDLAEHVLATRESVNKCLGGWMRAGIVQRTHSQIVIDDLARLAVISAARA